MGDSTRSSNKRHQGRALNKRSLVALLFSTLLVALPAPLYSAAVMSEPSAPQIVSSIAQDTAHEIALRNVEVGSESISLSARLATASATLAENVVWEIRGANSELLFTDTQTEFNAKLPPGDIVVEARYGAVSLRETLTLLKGQALSVNFVLNAGGLRVLPAISDVSGSDLATHTLVYALSGPQKGKLITHSRTPGEILKLAAGQYRVESRYGAGNAIAVTDVRVRPARISAVEIKHQAGLARLSYVGAATAEVTWQISEGNGPKIASVTGLNHAFALKPGTYLAEALVNGETLSARFKIGIGEERDIILGN